MKFSLTDWAVKKLTKWLTRMEPPRRAYLCDFERIRYEIRPGDVLLVEGRNRISRWVKKSTQSPWSHAALYIGRLYDIDDPELRQKIREHFSGSSDSQLVIESMIGKGTIVTPLSFYRHDHLRICRPQGLSRHDAQEIIRYAVSRLGGKYHLRQVFDMWRFLLPWWGYFRRWHSVLFDGKGSQALYDICSSMIADAFRSVNFPILPIVKQDDENGIELIQRNTRLYTPSDFDYSPYFDIIKYPFFSLSEKAPYHHLPWKEGAIGIDDEREYYLAPVVSDETLDTTTQHATEQSSDDTDPSEQENPKEPASPDHISEKNPNTLADILKKVRNRRTHSH
jgi:hypothetical protein